MGMTESATEEVILRLEGTMTPAAVSRLLEGLDDVSYTSSVRILIDSPGGCVRYGSRLWQALGIFAKPITAEITGEAAQVAAAVALSCPNRIMHESGSIVLSNSTPFSVSPKQSEWERCRVFDRSVADIIAHRAGVSWQDASVWMAEGRRFGAVEALQRGLVGAIATR